MAGNLLFNYASTTRACASKDAGGSLLLHTPPTIKVRLKSVVLSIPRIHVLQRDLQHIEEVPLRVRAIRRLRNFFLVPTKFG